MLNQINKQGVQSDKGWVFQRVHRFYYHYMENDFILKIVVESGEVFLDRNLRWEPPFESDSISDEKREKIKSRVLEALRFMGSKYKLTEEDIGVRSK